MDGYLYWEFDSKTRYEVEKNYRKFQQTKIFQNLPSRNLKSIGNQIFSIELMGLTRNQVKMLTDEAGKFGGKFQESTRMVNV